MPLLTTYAAATGRSYGARLSVPAFSLTIVAGATNVNEGDTISFTATGTDVVDGTYYWQVNHITTASADFSASTGSFTMSDGTGTFTITTVADTTTEGAQTFTASILGTATGPVVATSSTITINDTSLTPYTITPAAGSVNEGSALTVNVTAQPIDDTYYWTINHVTTADADFSAVSGTVTTTGAAGSFTITAADDFVTEGAQTFTISLRSGSITGTVLATSTSVTINDTSLTPSVTLSPAVGGVSTFNPYTQPAFSTINFGGTSCGTWTVTPNNNITAELKVWGAGGGGTNHTPSGITSYGGGGGYTGVNMILLKNTAYHFIVGCGGGASVGPGSDRKGAGGGGASAIRVVSGSIVIAVAGGGGGGGYSNTGGAQGGAGGGYDAQPGAQGGTDSGQGPQLAEPYYPAGGGVTNYDGTPGPVGVGGRNFNGAGSPGSGTNGGAGYPGNGSGAAGGSSGYGSGGSGGYYSTNAGGGGGGGGFRGGGGGGGDVGGDGGGGGSGYWDGNRTNNGSSETGSGTTPGNSGDSDRGAAGNGGATSAGQPGKIVWAFY